MVQELSQNSDRDFVAKGDEARDVQDWPRAIANYGHALESDSKVAGGIWVQYGHALKENGQLVDAEQAYKTAQKHSNGDPDPHLHLGHVLKAQGRMNEAESEYADALVLSRGSVDAVVELKDLGWTDAKIRSTLSNIESDRNNKRDGKNILVFDLTDLFQYLGQNRIVTGIQRVQADILEAAMQDQAIETIIVSYSKVSRRWVEVPPDYFALIKNAASRGSDINEKTWSIAIGRLNRVIDNGLYFEFTENSTLINLGTSWDFDNYALTVRNAKIEYNIKYIVFIHDCVPLLFPETCVDEQRRKYTGWVRGVLFEADQVLVNSEATSRDVMHLAEIIKIEIQEPIVCRLDGQYKSAEQTYASEFDLQVLKNLDLVRGSFVLYVSTLEPRKNHLFAFNGWLSMIKRRGLDNVPDLVCVGKTSYFHEILLKHLEASSLLKQRVHLFTNISDIELASLYRSCCFTIYPSRYEGWGLPITEALCHGKTAVVTNISSLPEAGGAFVDYFELGNEPDFTMKVERMIDHRPYLQERENHIATHFEPRSWRDVA
ncbi:MAG: glycosyltransferase involved in cell wall biosynthesis, partial [Arenicella sp.]